jgi:hypothetical protein
MPVLRPKRSHEVIPMKLVNDESLTFGARGLIIFLLLNQNLTLDKIKKLAPEDIVEEVLKSDYIEKKEEEKTIIVHEDKEWKTQEK